MLDGEKSSRRSFLRALGVWRVDDLSIDSPESHHMVYAVRTAAARTMRMQDDARKKFSQSRTMQICVSEIVS